MIAFQDPTIYFDHPKLHMTSAERFLIRLISGIGYIFFLTLTGLFIISDISGLQFIGVFILLFFADRLIHIQEADKHLSEIKNEKGLNIASYFSPATLICIEKAIIKNPDENEYLQIQILKELLNDNQIKNIFFRLDVNQKTLLEKIDSWIEKDAQEKRAGYEATNIFPVLFDAFQLAKKSNQNSVQPKDLLIALFMAKYPYIERLENTFGINAQIISESISLEYASAKFHQTPQRRFQTKRNTINRSWTSQATPTLDYFGTDMTKMASEGLIGKLIGHKLEYEQLVNTLSRNINPNALLIGEAGIGKNTLVEHLAADIANDRAPQNLSDYRIIELNISNLVANVTPEELQGRLQKIFQESLSSGNIILYIPRLHELINTSGQNHLSAIDALIPIFESGSLPIISSAGPQEFKHFIEPREDIVSYFEKINIEEISTDEAFLMLAHEARILEKLTNITIRVNALKKAIVLAKKYLHHHPLPGNALELLKDSIEAVGQERKKTLDPEDVVRVAELKAHIPIHRPEKEEIETLLRFEDIVHQRYVDQEEGVKSIADALREYRSGLSRKNGPIASFLFVGPTGVGKTALCKIIAELQFGSKDLLIRFDMSEFQDKKSFERFIGSADGNILGALTEAVREKPRSVILLDEFEKAHSDILHLFLQVFDEGRLTDGLGRTVSFENSVLVATSNAHSKDIETALASGQSIAQISENFKQTLVDVYTPELLNRFSKIIVFKNLSHEDIEKITKLELSALSEVFEEKNIILQFDDLTTKKIAALGYDPAFGARPLRKVIEEQIRAPLAKAILKNEFKQGDTITAALQGGEIIFSKK